MDRRRNRRWPRQLEVRLWKRGEEAAAWRGISTNVSRTGIFVRTQRVLPSGTRLRLEVVHLGRGFVGEGVVMRALKTPSHLQSVMPSGMGIRFLRLEELLEELLPGVDLLAEERLPEGISQPASGAARSASPARGGASDAAHEDGSPPAAERAAQAATSDSAAAQAAGNRQGGEAAGPQIAGGARFPLRFRDRAQFRRAFDRDIATGGLFISTVRPAALDSVVEVEVAIEGVSAPPVRLQARVVHRLEPTPGETGNLLAGMGVQFLDVQDAVTQLRALL
jgi:hypothetical protein